MNALHWIRWCLIPVLLLGFVGLVAQSPWSTITAVPLGREVVVFWHFWGGADRDTVDDVVRRFNDSQSQYFVRAIAMPGANLDLKLFLSVTGGRPPDVVNQDDPILGDWASRGAILPLREVAGAGELENLRHWLYPAARRLTEYDGELYALCNGLDVRALYYNATMLDSHGLQPPETIADLDTIAVTITPPQQSQRADCFGFLPNPRNLWAWGYVFGGQFVDPLTGRVTLDHPGIVAALEWMSSYGARYGTNAISFRARDQSLPGKSFPLLANRYATIVDGQWRIREIEQFQAERYTREAPGDDRHPEFGVCPLPRSPDGPRHAGWINGNFFVIPCGAANKEGAWEFMKFWSGWGNHEAEAADTCVRGGWIPVSRHVVAHATFQRHVNEHPLWEVFLQLAASDAQQPRPNIRSAPQLDRVVREVAERAMYGSTKPNVKSLLEGASKRFNASVRSQSKPSS